MKVSCPSCDAKYTIADEKVLGKKIKVRCKTCNTQILVDGTVPQGTGASGGAASAEEIQAEASQPSNSAPEPGGADSWTVNLSDTEERTMTTQEIAQGALRGELAADVFVWKEGMGDWALVTDVPELKAAIDAARSAASGGASRTSSLSKPPAAAKAAPRPTFGGKAKASGSVKPPAEHAGEKLGPIVAAPGSALAKKMAAAKSAAAAPKAEPAPEPPKEPKPEPEKKAATRLAAKRAQSTHDLFAAVDQAGSEIDVDTSAVDEHDHAKATGARNENSVLFSLDALKSGLGGAPKAPSTTGTAKKAPPPPAKRLEDLMTVDAAPMGAIGGGGLLLSGNEALLTAPAPPPPKPEPKPVPVAVGAGGEVYVPARRSKIGLVVGIIAGVGVVGTAGAVLALKFSGHEVPPAASTLPSKALASASAPVASASASAAASSAPAASASEIVDAGVPSAVASAAPTPAAGRAASERTASKSAAESKAEKKAETKPEPAQPAVSGSFSRDAAVAALSVAASQATVCKRPEGPWGSGKCLVTFAPSGRVTTANVTGAPFAGTSVGGCVANVFRRARIPAFSGDAVTVSKSFTIAP